MPPTSTGFTPPQSIREVAERVDALLAQLDVKGHVSDASIDPEHVHLLGHPGVGPHRNVEVQLTAPHNVEPDQFEEWLTGLCTSIWSVIGSEYMVAIVDHDMGVAEMARRIDEVLARYGTAGTGLTCSSRPFPHNAPVQKRSGFKHVKVRLTTAFDGDVDELTAAVELALGSGNYLVQILPYEPPAH
jgi:hypothetical protein